MASFTSARLVALLVSCASGVRKVQRRAACGEEPPSHDGPNGGGQCRPCASDGIYFWNATCDAETGTWKCQDDYGPGYRQGMYEQDCPEDWCFPPPPLPNAQCINRSWVCDDGYVRNTSTWRVECIP